MFNIELIHKKWAPVRAHEGDAGLDLRATEDAFLEPGDAVLVPTGIKVEIPYGFVGLLYSRSGMAKYRITLANSVGVIDHSYRGEVKAYIINHGDVPYRITAGERIAQLVVVPCMLDYNIVDSVSETNRGENGFGSTGNS